MGKVARFFNLSDDNTFQKGKDTKKQGRELRGKGVLDKRTNDELQAINFGAQSDRSAFKITDAIDELQNSEEKFFQETLTYGKATAETTRRLEEAQKATTEAIKNAKDPIDASDNTRDAIVDDAAGTSGLFGLNKLFFSAQKGFDNVVQFFGGEASRAVQEKRDLLKLKELDISNAKELKAFLFKLVLSDKGSSLPSELRELLSKIALDTADPSKQLTEAINKSLEVELSQDGMFPSAIFARISEQLLKGGETNKFLFDAFADEARQQFILNSERMATAVETALNLNEMNNPANLAALDLSERKEILTKVTDLQSTQREVRDALGGVASADTPDSLDSALIKLRLVVENKDRLERELSDLVSEGVKTGLLNSNFGDVRQKFIDLGLGDVVSAQIASGVDNSASGTIQARQSNSLLANIARLKEVNKEIEKVQDSTKAWTTASSRQYAGLLKTQAEIRQSLIDIGNVADLKLVEPSEVQGLLSAAVGLSTVKNVDLDKLYKVGPDSAKKIAELAGSILSLKLAASTGVSPDGLNTDQIIEMVEEQTKQLNELFKSFGSKVTTGGGSSETLFEKFVGGLNDSGFSIDIEQAAALSAGAINGLQGPLKAIKAAQERIRKASLGDNAARTASIATIKKQRDAISGILTAGTVGQANIGLEGLGIDPSLATNAANTDSLLRISGLQDDLNNTLFTDFETRKSITSEILNQQRLLEGVTTVAEASTASIKDSIKESFSGLLKGTMSFKDAMHNVLDALSSRIIDTVVGSFVDAMFEASGMQDMFDSLFAGLFSGGNDLGKKAGEGIGKAITEGIDGSASGGAGGLFKSLGEGFTSLLSGLSDGLSGIFSSIGGLFGGGGGGGMGGLFSLFSGPFVAGFSQGGTVRNVPGSQAGKDSVPAMLMPGEVVLSKSAVSRMGSSNQGSTQQFNINVQGDVSRQTRQEIVKMMPQIAGGVNAQNKENNYKR
jgi:hypothetical protein